MHNLSVRGIEEASLRRLKQMAKRRGVSLNRLIADLLNTEGGNAPTRARSTAHDDLDQLAGTWSKRDAREFERAVASFEQIDEELWR